MSKIVALLRLNRTRNQMLLGFLLVTAIVFTVAGGFVYRTLSDLLIQEAEAYVGQTAAQASARLDAVFAQVDSLTLQLVTDARIQDLLYQVRIGEPVTIEQKLSVRPILDNLMAFSWQIESIELYADDEPFYPLENENFSVRIGVETATFANLREGQLVWTGSRLKDDNHLLAARQIRLEQDYLSGGGYIVVKVTDALLSFFHTEFSAIKDGSIYLYDQRGKLVAASSNALLHSGELNVLTPETDVPSDTVGSRIMRIDGVDYLKILRKSAETNWSVLMLVPLATITDGLWALKQALYWAAAVSIIACLLLVWLLSSLITKPIIKLRAKMRAPLNGLPKPNTDIYFNFEMNELNLSYNKLVHELQQVVETVYEKERLKNQAEIKMLQAQIHPHFLFNTLESLHWMLVDKQEHEAAQIVMALSKLFRYTIRSSDGEDWSKLSDELEHCRLYLEIMQHRLGERLSWHIDVQPTIQNVRLPKLLLQPLVENAIQHGLEPQLEGGMVTIRISAEQRLLHIRITDNGRGMGAESLNKLQKRLRAEPVMKALSPGLGLLNVQYRVKLYYGEQYGLQVQSAPQQGTAILLTIPFGG